MNGVDHLRQDLAFVDRMIAECLDHIEQLQKAPAKTPGDAQDPHLADDVLGCFTAALTRYEAERDRLVSAIGDSKANAGQDRPPPANDRSTPRRAKLVATRQREALAE